MENEIQQNIPPVQPLPQTSNPIPTQPSTNWSKILLFTVLGLVVVAGSVFASIQIGKTQTSNQQPIATQPTVSPKQTVTNPTAKSPHQQRLQALPTQLQIGKYTIHPKLVIMYPHFS